MSETTDKKIKKGKVLRGTAVSTKMKDTVVVEVERYVKHPRYGKYIRKRKKIKAHDVGNSVNVGDKVAIMECKPISRDKRFMVVKN